MELKCKEKGCGFQWLRGFYIVGNTEDGCSIFSKIVQASHRGQTEFPFTMGLNQFDFLDYETFCKYVAHVVEQDEINGIINISAGRPEKLADRVERFITENRFGIKLNYGAFPDRPYDSKAIWGDDLKIRMIEKNIIVERMQLMTKQMTKNIPVRMLLINHSCGVGSTGKICVQIADEYTNKGTEVKIAYGRNSYVPAQYKKYAVRIGTSLDVKLHALKTRLFDGHGYGSKKATKQFLKWADRYNPDLLWLHCIHGYYINFELLFKWIKQRPDMYVKWTQHDCWAFTGHCAHFTIAKCEKWKTACKECPERKSYPASFLLDKSDDNFFEKGRHSPVLKIWKL